jgi:hypothetical protein
VLYYQFFSLTFDILQAISLFKVGSLWTNWHKQSVHKTKKTIETRSLTSLWKLELGGGPRKHGIGKAIILRRRWIPDNITIFSSNIFLNKTKNQLNSTNISFSSVSTHAHWAKHYQSIKNFEPRNIKEMEFP